MTTLRAHRSFFVGQDERILDADRLEFMAALGLAEMSICLNMYQTCNSVSL